MDKNWILLFFAYFVSFTVTPKDRADLAVSSIPNELKENADAVIRTQTVSFSYNGLGKGSESNYEEITILNERGLRNAHFSAYTDKFRKIKSFSAATYNGEGKLIKQYKKSDLSSSEWSSNLTSDDVTYFFSCPTPVFPFTIVYQYDFEWNKGIRNFPVFVPQTNTELSVQKASYTLSVPSGTEILYEGNKFIPKPEIKEDKNRQIYAWKIDNLKPIVSEPFSPNMEELIPRLYVAPVAFLFDNYEGSFASIESMGVFQNKLNDGRGALSDDAKGKIKEMTQNAQTEKEKIKILYDFLGQTTRYESIQLGIGGFQPMTSADVNNYGYGDCKALSFYLKSMLDVIGIPSNYTVIRSDRNKKNLEENFTAYLQSNHVILQVPLAQDTLWLECTNTKVPMGYVHRNIAGHDAIVVLPGSAKVEKLPDYDAALNLSENNITIHFNFSEPSQIEIVETDHLKRFDELLGFSAIKKSEQIDFVRRKLRIPNASIADVSVEENLSAEPFVKLSYKATASPLGTVTGNRMFVPLNVFRTNMFRLKKGTRKNDIQIIDGFNDVDNISLHLPENVEVEFLPPSVSFESPFGTFTSNVSQDGKNITIQQNFLLKKGRWSADEYENFRQFIERVFAMYSEAIVLKSV